MDLLVWLGAHARPGRRPDDLVREACGAGLLLGLAAAIWHNWRINVPVKRS